MEYILIIILVLIIALAYCAKKHCMNKKEKVDVPEHEAGEPQDLTDVKPDEPGTLTARKPRRARKDTKK